MDPEIKNETREALKIASLSEVILGGQDGLVNVLGVILGVAAASHSTPIILLEIAIIGMGAAIIGYGIGLLFQH